MKYRYRNDDEMKDSGIKVINSIPITWRISRIKNITKVYGRIGFRGYTIEDLVDEGNGAITLSPSNIENQKLILNKRTYISWEKYEESPEIKIFNSDIIFVKTASVGKVAFIEGLKEFATINPQFIVFKGIKGNSKFLYYVMVSNVIQEQVNKMINGGVLSTLTQQDINNYSIPFVNMDEQNKIVALLDKKTSQFDSIISKKEALIQKLEEAKKSLISEVVTGKVKVVKNSDGYELVERKKEEMKDSGVEWLGDIPKEWEVKKIKHVLVQPLKYGANESSELDDRSLPRYIRITDFSDNGQLKDETFKSLELDKARDYYLKEGDILFARSGATVGKTFLFKNYKGKACFAGYLIKASLNKKLVKPEFLYSFTKSKGYDNWKNSVFMQATIQNIGADKYKELKFMLPDRIEQELICKYIEKKDFKYNYLINRVKQQIGKLKEAKQSLISEAVTGKIEVLD